MQSLYTIFTTKDGSHSIRLADSDVTFHSINGAMQESQHIFIEAGLQFWMENNAASKSISVFEMGFGTGLNALLTAMYALQHKVVVRYHSIDRYPLPEAVFSQLNYAEIVKAKELYHALMQAPWNAHTSVHSFFTLHKIQGDFLQHTFQQAIDLFYFDAFAPQDATALWTEATFCTLFKAMKHKGVLVTYCSKSVVRKALQAAGFVVQKLPGPPGKREMVRALKP